METKKKPTNAQLLRRLENAVVHIDRDKSYKTIFFSDKGLRLEVTDGECVISTNYHRHIFANATMGGVSRPYIYTRRLLEIALENDCSTKDGYSFAKLLETLKAKEDQAEYNITVLTDWWIFNCEMPLYSIGESVAENFFVYEDYIHNIAKNGVILDEKKDDMTNRQFADKMFEKMKEFMAEVPDYVIFKKKTDEELLKEEMDAAMEMEVNKTLSENEDKD